MITFRNTTRLAIIGDSIVAAGTYNGYFTSNRHYYQGGAAINNPNLSDGTPTFPPVPTYLISGVPGNTAADVDARIQVDILNIVPQPTVVIIAVGINDLGANKPAFSASYTSILSKCLASGISPSNIICVNVIGSTDAVPGPDGVSIADLNTRIAACALAAGAVLVDIRQAFIDWETLYNPTNDINGTPPYVIMNGGIHPVFPVGFSFCVNTLIANTNLIRL